MPRSGNDRSSNTTSNATTRKPTQRTHTFTGCFTCRRRRVKCDGDRPACTRCKNAGFECLGYGFRFDAPDGVQSNRQRLNVSSRPDLVLNLSSKQVDKYLADIDEAGEVKASGDVRKGPFAVLSFRPDAVTNPPRNPPPLYYNLVLSPKRRSFPDRDSNINHHTSQQNGRQTTDLFAIIPTQHAHNENSHQLEEKWMMPSLHGRSNIPPYLSAVNMPVYERELFGFYTSYINTTGPLAHRQTIPMMALSGHVSNWRGLDPNARAVVFHGVCAFIAKSLALMRNESHTYRVRAYNHEQLALSGLRTCIEASSTSFLALATACQTLMLCGHQVGMYTEAIQHLAAGIHFAVLAVESQHDTDGATASICEQFLVAVALMKYDISQHDLFCSRKGVGIGIKRVSPTGLFLPYLEAIILINRTLPFRNGLPRQSLTEIEQTLQAAHPPLDDPEIDSDLQHAEQIIHYAIRIYFALTLLHHAPFALRPIVLEGVTRLESLDIPQATNAHALLIWTLAIFVIGAGEDSGLVGRVFAWCRNAVKFNQGCHDTPGMCAFFVRVLKMRPEFGGDESWYERVSWSEMVGSAGTARDPPVVSGRVMDIA